LAHVDPKTLCAVAVVVVKLAVPLLPFLVVVDGDSDCSDSRSGRSGACLPGEVPPETTGG
jgi:hypothetical protein